MAIKNGNYAVLEAIHSEMQRDPYLTLLYEYQRPTAVGATGKVIDLYKDFGPVRVPDWGPIDEEWFVGACAGMAMTGVKMAHVPYRGSNPALTDIMGGQVQVLFDNMPSSIELIRSGKIRALAVTTEKRAPYFPDVPTVDETVKGYEASAWFGMGAPAKTPKDVVAVLNRAIIQVLEEPRMRARIADLGGQPMHGTPDDFGKIVASETEKWRKVVEFAGASVD